MPTQAILYVNAHEQPWLSHARELFIEYGESIADIAACSLRHQGFDNELATLPGLYAPHSGSIILAVSMPDQRALGCVALRPLPGGQPHQCEMKRMYVRPEARKRGVAKAMSDRLLHQARAAGYTEMVLDTAAQMHPAIALYTALGFRAADRYNDDPDPDTLWFKMSL